MKGLWNNGPIVDQANAAITGGAITGVSGVPYDLARWDIPVIQCPTGTMANNGAVTFGTALPTTYANCYIVLPAGAIASGVPAAEESYFCQMSSTTVGTIFNNTQAANANSVGAPTIPASPTAFATTGPGAFTGVTTTRTIVGITMPAAAMGANGEVDIYADHQVVNAGTNKTTTCTFGGTTVVGVTQTTVTNINYWSRVKNRAVATSQRESHVFSTSSSSTVQPSVYLTINTANAVIVNLILQKATATEYAVLEGGRVTVTPT